MPSPTVMHATLTERGSGEKEIAQLAATHRKIRVISRIPRARNACSSSVTVAGGAAMAIEQLSDEQVRSMTLAEKDRWWRDYVFKGDMPQLTIRSAITGMFLGGLLSLTNLYVGAKTGWTLGVGITSVILAFAMFKVLSKIGLGREFTLLENNCMRSIATAAGYMTAPMISSLAAYMMITNTVIPMSTTFVWLIVLAL